MCVIVRKVGLIALNVFVTRSTVHDAFSGGAHNCAAYRAHGRTHWTSTYRAHNTASHGARRGGAARGCMLLVFVRDHALVILTCCALIHVALLEITPHERAACVPAASREADALDQSSGWAVTLTESCSSAPPR